ncbi:MAG: hypothetical protein ACKO14_01665 [Armatimonadota bacterium]
MKIKVSRPVIYIAVAAVIGAAVYFYTEPAPVVRKAVTKKPTLRQSVGIPGILPEDYELKFATVSPAPRDVFRPLVARTTTRGVGGDGGFGTGGWRLTGISIVNGQRQATVESTNGDLASLRLGQTFDGYSVRAISDLDITVEGPDGKREKLRFVDPTVVEPEPVRTNTAPPPSVSSSTRVEPQPSAQATDLGTANNNQRRRNRNQGNQ